MSRRWRCTGSAVNRYDESDAAADVVELVVDAVPEGPDGALDVVVTGHFDGAIAASAVPLPP
ncbi:MAG: hypothetical protein FJ137_20795 [Deltaproteobacteria bacterium]|nr:hypothetical protein [Deltaproteobacteria bacterium]